MKMLAAFLVCVGIGYFAEVYFENPNQNVVWIIFSFLTFGAYIYLTHITSFAFALPLVFTSIFVSSAFAYVTNEPAIILIGIYAAIFILIVLGQRFIYWAWSDWRSPAKILEALSTKSRIK